MEKNNKGIDLKENQKILLEILTILRSMRYGYIQIIVQDSKIVQIDKTEKIRLDKQKGGIKDKLTN